MSENAVQMAEASTIASKVTATGGITSLAALFTQIDWLALMGVLIALSGFYFSYQRNKREKEIHELTKKKLEDQCNAEQD